MTDDSKRRLDPRIVRTRQLLKEAFIDLLQEMDIEKISVNRIAERSTINRVTFYLHYRDIPDMMEKMADEMAEDIQRVLDSSQSNPTAFEKSDSSILIRLLEHISENAKFYKIILGTKRTPIFTERLLHILSNTIEQRIDSLGSDSFLVKSGIPKDITVWYGSSVLIGTIVAWLRNDMPYTPHYLAKQFSMLLRNYHLVK